MDSDNKELLERPPNLLSRVETDIMKDLRTGGCPVCNHMEEVTFDYLAKWQSMLTNDETTQQEYAAELGFCPAHTWQLSTVASTRGLSRGYPKLLERIADELTKLNGASPDISNGVASLLKSSESCRVCRLLKNAEEIYTRRLAAFLGHEDGRAAYTRSHGVCLRHLSLLVSFLTSQDIVQFLVSETAKNLREAARDMRCYVSKHEALERHLITRGEKYAYLRALVNIAGARNVCAPHIRRI